MEHHFYILYRAPYPRIGKQNSMHWFQEPTTVRSKLCVTAWIVECVLSKLSFWHYVIFIAITLDHLTDYDLKDLTNRRKHTRAGLYPFFGIAITLATFPYCTESWSYL